VGFRACASGFLTRCLRRLFPPHDGPPGGLVGSQLVRSGPSPVVGWRMPLAPRGGRQRLTPARALRAPCRLVVRRRLAGEIPVRREQDGRQTSRAQVTPGGWPASRARATRGEQRASHVRTVRCWPRTSRAQRLAPRRERVPLRGPQENPAAPPADLG